MSAVFSSCLKYRYVLRRNLADNERTCLFIMLNPSTADEVQDDPTVRRCIGYAKRWGYGKLIVCNIFAYRATNPKELYELGSNAIGVENTHYISQAVRETLRTKGVIVCAWGSHGAYLGQGEFVKLLVKTLGVEPYCLKLNKDHQPSHPLYLKSDIKIELIG